MVFGSDNLPRGRKTRAGAKVRQPQLLRHAMTSCRSFPEPRTPRACAPGTWSRKAQSASNICYTIVKHLQLFLVRQHQVLSQAPNFATKAHLHCVCKLLSTAVSLILVNNKLINDHTGSTAAADFSPHITSRSINLAKTTERSTPEQSSTCRTSTP